MDIIYYNNVTILFADICDYTKMCSELSTIECINTLNKLFTIFDDNLTKYGVNFVQIIGDCYMIVCGIKNEKDHALRICEFAKFMLISANSLNINIHIGISSGEVTSALIGNINKNISLFGDTVNIASRMENCGYKNCIHLSEISFLELISEGENVNNLISIGVRTIKNKGLMHTYLYKFGNWEKELAIINSCNIIKRISRSLDISREDDNYN